MGPTWEAGCRQRRSTAPIICEKDQHGLLALMVASARCKLQWGGVERAPPWTLDCHQQTLVAAFIFGPVTNLGNQTNVTMDWDRHCTVSPQASPRPAAGHRGPGPLEATLCVPWEGAAPGLQHRGHCGRSQHQHSLQSTETSSGKDGAAPRLLEGLFPPPPKGSIPPCHWDASRELHWHLKGCWG